MGSGDDAKALAEGQRALEGLVGGDEYAGVE